jgi:autoinducer 2 (AI-2) kinase
MTHHLMAFDAGTGAGRCTLFDTQGNLVASAYQEWEYTTPPEASPQGKIFSPQDFWSILCTLSRQVIHQARVDPAHIVGVSTTSQREGMVFLDRAGRELYAGPNIDNRGQAEYAPFTNHEDQVRAITGTRLFTLYGPARLLWFKHYQPHIYDQIHRVVMISDWIAYRLCGEYASEATIASSSQLLDIRTRTWSEEVLKLFDLREDILPPLLPAGSPMGFVTKAAAQKTGLKSGTPVAVGGGDTHLGMLGIRVIEPLCISAVAGTSTPVMATSQTPSIDFEKRVSTSCYVTPGYWVLESNAGMTGMPLRWVRDTFARDIVANCMAAGEDPFNILSAMAAEVPPGSGGWRAYLGGGRAGDPHYGLGGFYFPLDWVLDHFDRRHLIRSAIETMAFSVRANVDQLKEITGHLQTIFPIGGGQTKSPLFNHILANTLNQPISIFKVKESTSLGTAICAAVGAGVYETLFQAAGEMVQVEQLIDPDPKLVIAYQTAYSKWQAFGTYLNHYQPLEE